MPEASMTCVLVLSRDLSGNICAHLGIDFPGVGGLPISQYLRRQNDLLKIIRAESERLSPTLSIGKPLSVGVLKIGTKGLQLVPIVRTEPTNNRSHRA